MSMNNDKIESLFPYFRALLTIHSVFFNQISTIYLEQRSISIYFEESTLSMKCFDLTIVITVLL